MRGLLKNNYAYHINKIIKITRAPPGETEWTKNGRYTGTTDLELTPTGMRQVTTTGTHLVGPGKLIDLHRVARIWVSPRKRAQQTLCLLVGGDIRDLDIADKVVLTEDIAEWDYGDYEGLVVHEIHAQRREKGLDREREWNIWRDGCEGGEYDLPIYSAGSDESNQVADVMDVIPRSAQHVAERLDRLIAQIREIQAPCMNGEKPADVVLVCLMSP